MLLKISMNSRSIITLALESSFQSCLTFYRWSTGYMVPQVKPFTEQRLLVKSFIFLIQNSKRFYYYFKTTLFLGKADFILSSFSMLSTTTLMPNVSLFPLCIKAHQLLQAKEWLNASCTAFCLGKKGKKRYFYQRSLGFCKEKEKKSMVW